MTVRDYPPDERTLTPDDALAQAAIDLTAELLQRAKEQQTRAEYAQYAKIARMMDDPDGKAITMALSDQAFRSEDPERIAEQIRYLLDVYGVPEYLTGWERAALKVGAAVSRVLPHLVVPFIVAKLRQETQNVILPGEPQRFRSYLERRRADGMRLNVNHLGEAILGEGEASRRLDAYLKLLARPDVEYISVKISSVFSQINLVAFDETVLAIEERLRTLYRQAMAHTYTQPDGTQAPKFVNLDMEEYRDLHLTVEAFKRVLDEPAFVNYRAGIVLQAYLPDSFEVQRDLTAWALERVANGGAPIKLRIVKGANLAMERVEASLHGWEQAPYDTKADVDANFKRMVTYGSQPERAHAVHLGIASHNLFDVAYSMVLTDKLDVREYVELEMLEGMSNHQARAVQNRAGGLLLYAPVVKREDFHSAIAYLIRRLDENTAPENFLHDLFGLEVGGATWDKQRELFLEAFERMDDAPTTPNRTQNRQTERIRFDADDPFENEPDTDFSLPQNQVWVREIRDRWQEKVIDPIPLQIGGEFIYENMGGTGVDPSQPDTPRYNYALATPAHINAALETAKRAQKAWAKRPVRERKAILVRCAEELAKRRGDLLGAMMLDGGKRVMEADPEISEGIDFANYYARSLDIADTELADMTFSPLGTVLITPPWNFPFAIPAGGTLAALMAGNAVIHKPAPETVLVSWHIMNALWDAGVPKDVLQFVPTTDDEVGKGLVTDERVGGVILTGAYATGKLFQSWQPDMRLFAETSGKNSLIITAMSDQDLAIKDLVKSAFGHNGQKCSASSLAILEKEVYDNPTFMRQLKDAAESLTTAPAWDLTSFMTPLIREPGDDLHRALTTLEPGESWLLEPKQITPNMWTPGIKMGVQPGSFFHKTECFGPVLGLMRAENLEHAIELQNAVDYGLTGGIHSLDGREIDIWRERVQVGNAYINRGTTGAIVQRQPFGGWKKSVFGFAKAGGPNYVLSLGTWRERDSLPDDERVERALHSYAAAWRDHFSQEHDPSGVFGEDNVFRYRPLRAMFVYVQPGDNPADAELAGMAAKTCGVPVTLLLDERVTDFPERVRAHFDAVVSVSADALVPTVQARADVDFARVRVLSPVPLAVREQANAVHLQLVDAPVVMNGRLELRYYLQEQAVSHTVHRYGNILRDAT